MANQIPATIGVMGTVATVDLNYGEKMVAFKRSVLEKMLGIQSATPKALRCFEFVLNVSYLSDDGTRGTQYNQKVLKEEDHQKHMKRVLKNGFYTAIRLVVNPLGDMAHVHKDMSEAMRNVRNLSTVNDHDIDWTIGIFNFYNTKFEETLTDLLDEKKKRLVAKSSADNAQGEQSDAEEDGEEEEAEESEDAEEAEEAPIETPPLSESEDEEDGVKDEMKVIVCNYQTKDKMFSGKVSISQDVKWLKDYMLEWQDVSKEDKMALTLCDKVGGRISEEMSICDAMKAMKSRTFYLLNKGLCGGASRITKVKRQEKSKTLQNKVQELVVEVASMRRDTSMQEVEAVIAQFMERSNTAPIDTIKDFLAKSEIVLLQKMDAEIKKSNSGKAEDKFKSVAPFFFGEKMQVLNDRKIAIEKIIATAKASMDFTWSKACEQDEKFSMPVFLSLIDKCISFKQGQASSTAPAPVPMQT